MAGPVVAGAVLLREPIPGLKDSKKLSKSARELLDSIIRVEALAYGLGWVPAEELDAIGLTAAVRLAMQRAVAAIHEPFEQIIIDGNYNFLAEDPRTVCVVKADDTVPAVSAASILAKVARDNYMHDMSREHPGYAFENHVGYGTAAHMAALQELGVSVLHRRSFAPIRALLES